MKILKQIKKQNNKPTLGDIYESRNEEDKGNNSKYTSQKNSVYDS